MESQLLDNAVNSFASLPGVGRKTALRLVLHLLRQPESEVQGFADSLTRLKREVHYCSECRNISDTEMCPICRNPKRDHATICVVENIQDVMSIENTGQYRGVYHVLGGVISPIDGIGPKDIEADKLVERVLTGDIKEVILALPTTMEGDTTNFYLYRRIMNSLEQAGRPTEDLTVSLIARGVAIGNELEYTDEITLGRSIINRTIFNG
ncbi:MAG: recombination protein RecR [Paludibacteraceae bacterium]|nr:recombination protein RecR [Paludibacteraceae bacterium]